MGTYILWTLAVIGALTVLGLIGMLLGEYED